MSGLYGGHYKPDELVTGPEMVQERKLCAQSVVGVLISNLREEAKTTIGYMKKAENRVIVFRNDKYAKTLDSSLTPQMNGGSSDFPEDIPDPSESAKLGENNRIAKQTCENSINNDNQPTASFVSAVSISSTTGAKPQSANQARIPSIEMSILVDRAKTCVPDDFTYKGAYKDSYEGNNDLMRFHFENYFDGNNRYVPKTTNYEVYLDPYTSNSVACIRSETYDAVRGGSFEGTNKMNVNCGC